MATTVVLAPRRAAGAASYRVRVERERPVVRAGQALRSLEFTIERQEDERWVGLLSAVNECPAGATDEEATGLLLKWAREVAPAGEAV